MVKVMVKVVNEYGDVVYEQGFEGVRLEMPEKIWRCNRPDETVFIQPGANQLVIVSRVGSEDPKKDKKK